MIRQKAFTLTELLIALTIVGAIAALSIPALVNDINSKVAANQLKNTIVQVQQIMEQELIENNTKSLADTAFTKRADVYTKFAKSGDCTEDCWGPKIDGSKNYKSLNKLEVTRNFSATGSNAIKLKNGVSLYYNPQPTEYAEGSLKDGTKDGDQCYGIFYIDINGKDKPNIVGRDFFAFRVTKKGNISYGSSCTGNLNLPDATLIKQCKEDTALTSCTALIQRHNWKITY